MRQQHIEDDEVDGAPFQDCKGLDGIAGREKTITLAFDVHLQEIQNIAVVIDNQYVFFLVRVGLQRPSSFA